MNLFLIGYRGSGKSSVAPLLSKLLGRVAVDTDQYIEQLAETSIKRIFETQGEEAFRSLEQKIVRGFPANANLIISLGGGAPIAKSNRSWMKATGKTVWLTAEPEVLWDRIHRDKKTSSQRPDLTDQGGLQEVQTVLAERSPIYAECADYTIDVQELTPQQIADKIAQWWLLVDKK